MGNIEVPPSVLEKVIWHIRIQRMDLCLEERHYVVVPLRDRTPLMQSGECAAVDLSAELKVKREQ